jgi:hypothetical protein
LELVDRLAERLPLLGVVDRVLERRTAEAAGARRELHPRLVEDAHEPAEAVTLGAETQVLGDEARLEVELAGRKQRPPSFGCRGPRTRPSSPASTTNAVIPLEREPGSTVAKTTQSSALGALPMIFLCPSAATAASAPRTRARAAAPRRSSPA